jgi:flagellar L-ring protein precursor FlgH
MNKCARLMLAATGALLALAGPARADDLFKPREHRALTADVRAATRGDILTVLVLENSSASSSTDTSSDKSTGVGVEATVLHPSKRVGGQISLSDDFAGKGRVLRSGRLVAQLSLTVQDVLPNGDLVVSGQQSIDINGEKNEIRLSGRVRRIDVSETNTVLSNRIADAKIEYVGDGYLSDRARPGWITKVLTWLGLW